MRCWAQHLRPDSTVWPHHTYSVWPCWAHQKYSWTVQSIIGLRQRYTLTIALHILCYLRTLFTVHTSWVPCSQLTTAACAATSAVSTARSAWCLGRGVTHLAQYFPPLLEKVHAPHPQSEAEEAEAMMEGLWVLVVTVVWGVVHAGCVCTACPCCFVRLTRISAPINWQTTAYWGSPKSS